MSKVAAVAIAIISALQAELELLLDVLGPATRSDIASWSIWSVRSEKNQVVLARAGIGKVNTGALTALVWERFRPDTIVFTGVAGALDPALGVGDVVVGERTIQHDAGVLGPAGLERYQAGHIPFFNPTDSFGFAPSPHLLAIVRRVADEVSLDPVLDRLPQITFGTIVTGDQFLRDTTRRDRLFAELGAQAVEMEGAAMAQVAQRVGCDHLVVRSLSDLAGADSDIDFARFVPEVSANSARLVLALIDRLEEDHRDLPVGS